ncbi:hypothetical protein [Mycobacterium sp.]|uniref:hypothetical protein n=1 Tax=Mycobacterium sp. TaxID=1785 RepID=UPI002D2834D9|nr:hypothetical protein [Mycobacterium sp.]HZA09045.1 hypothetical protein [Mycobacterium sp.]
MLPIDPDADASRRAWLRCSVCDYGAGCRDCESSRNCGTHWQYLLSNQGAMVNLQCPNCGQVWSLNTRRGGGEPQIDAA